MARHIRINIRNFLFLTVAVACMIGFAAGTAFAQTAPAVAAPTVPPAEGCNPDVAAVHEAMADAQDAKDESIDDEIEDQNDSNLATSCTNQGFAVSAQQSGKIFSGDFTKALKPVMEDAGSAMLGNFNLHSLGAKTGLVNYTKSAVAMPTTPETNYGCNQTATLATAVNTTGVKRGVPAPTIDDLINGAATNALQGALNGMLKGGGVQGILPGATNGLLNGLAGPNFSKSWASPNSQAAFTNLSTRVRVMPKPKVPDYTNTNSVCGVMQANDPAVACP